MCTASIKTVQARLVGETHCNESEEKKACTSPSITPTVPDNIPLAAETTALMILYSPSAYAANHSKIKTKTRVVTTQTRTALLDT